MFTSIHTHTYIHTYIHTHIYTYVHTHIHTYIHTYTYEYMCMHLYIYANMYLCPSTYLLAASTYTHWHTPPCLRIYKHACMQQGVCAHISLDVHIFKAVCTYHVYKQVGRQAEKGMSKLNSQIDKIHTLTASQTERQAD